MFRNWVIALLVGLVIGLLTASGCQPQLVPLVHADLPRANETPSPNACGVIVAPHGSGQVVRGEMPDVVRMNLALAESVLGSAGFENVVVQDSTGDSRSIGDKSTWYVVDQHPLAGTTGPQDLGIVLTANTYSDSDCPKDLEYGNGPR